MKIVKTILLLLIVAALAVFITTCKKGADQKMADAQENVAEAGQDVKDAAVITWEQYKADANARMDENDKFIANYKAMMTDANGKLKASYNKKIEALEKQNKVLKAKLNDYKDDGKSSWEKFKSELDNDMEALGKSLKGFTVDNK